MSDYTCPRCRCGSMFEDHGKLVCFNCDYECSKLAAKSARHEHTYVSYQKQAPHPTGNFKHVETPKYSPNKTFENTSKSSSSPQQTQKKGCSSLVFIIFIVYFLFLFFGGALGILN